MEPTRFVTDAMLGSLARKLRVFGFDTAYFRRGSDSELLEIARTEGRVLLTSDRALAEASARTGVVSILIHGSDEGARIRSMEDGLRRASLTLEAGPTRCALCNLPLLTLRRSDVRSELPDAIARRHRVYYRCPGCHKLYWKGSHWKRLRTLSSLLDGGQ